MPDPTHFGRKRRARRSRGRRAETSPPYSSAALAMATVFKADAERASFWRPFAEQLAADFVRQYELGIPTTPPPQGLLRAFPNA